MQGKLEWLWWESGPLGPRKDRIKFGALAPAIYGSCSTRNPDFFHYFHRQSKAPDLSSTEHGMPSMDVMQKNRALKRLLLHEFVVMPDHLRLILTPAPNVSLEKAVQYIKGGFSFRAKKELGYKHLIWEESFNDHRIQDDEDYERHREYIHHNPVKAGLVKTASEYPYSSASIKCDTKPSWLKPRI